VLGQTIQLDFVLLAAIAMRPQTLGVTVFLTRQIFTQNAAEKPGRLPLGRMEPADVINFICCSKNCFTQATELKNLQWMIHRHDAKFEQIERVNDRQRHSR
jgi:hypothetical protein